MTRHLPTLLALALVSSTVATATTFQSDFANTPDGVWAGPEYWINPLQDWRIADGRLECLSKGAGRNVQLLTWQATDTSEFEMRVTVTRPTDRLTGTVGMRFGLQGKLDDHRFNAIWGKGIQAGMHTDGMLVLGDATAEATWANAVILTLSIRENDGETCKATLTATTPAGETLGTVESELEADQLRGNLALLCDGKDRWGRGDPVVAFSNWRVEGTGFTGGPAQNWGPILWSQYTLHENVLKLQAQLAPVVAQGTTGVELHYRGNRLTAEVDPLSRTALFRITDWDATKDAPYRLTCDWNGNTYEWAGTVRHDPVDKPAISIAGLTGNKDFGFPNPTLVANLERLDPDVLFFSGDQLYEGNAGFGIVRTPVPVATLDYLRKWYLVGWSFRNLMKDRPTIHLPDDHDVYQGNIWGAGGRAIPKGKRFGYGGYMMAAEWVNMVQRTQTGHMPDPPDPAPIDQGIGVYFGDMTYGRIGMAILEDRKFKTGATSPEANAEPIGQATILGHRQLAFLEQWAGDWKNQDFKVTLSQTVFGQCHTYGGKRKATLAEDRDANGWPPPARDRAIRTIRKAHAFMYAGDNHLPTVVHHGVDTWEDAGISFTVPSIAAGFPREWRPDLIGKPREGPLPEHLAKPTYTGPVPDYIGRFTSSWKHPLTFYAVANPRVFTNAGGGKEAGDLQLLDDKSSGFGMATFHKPSGRITLDCYRLLADLDDPATAQMPGWPVTLTSRDNYAREVTGRLPEVTVEGVDRPVLSVIDETTGERVYAIRLNQPTVHPWIFADGLYTVTLGDPDTGNMKTWQGLKPAKVSPR